MACCLRSFSSRIGGARIWRERVSFSATLEEEEEEEEEEERTRMLHKLLTVAAVVHG